MEEGAPRGRVPAHGSRDLDRHGRGFEHSKVQPCAIHQKREHSATGFAGVMFSLDTKNGIRGVTVSGSKGNTGNIY